MRTTFFKTCGVSIADSGARSFVTCDPGHGGRRGSSRRRRVSWRRWLAWRRLAWRRRWLERRLRRRIRKWLRLRGCCPRPRRARRRDHWFAVSVLWLRLCHLPAGRRRRFLGFLREQVQIVRSGERDVPRLRRLTASLPVSSPSGLSAGSPLLTPLWHEEGANSSVRCPYGRAFPTQITFTPISLAKSVVRNRMSSGVASVKNLAASVLSPRLLA